MLRTTAAWTPHGRCILCANSHKYGKKIENKTFLIVAAFELASTRDQRKTVFSFLLLPPPQFPLKPVWAHGIRNRDRATGFFFETSTKPQFFGQNPIPLRAFENDIKNAINNVPGLLHY